MIRRNKPKKIGKMPRHTHFFAEGKRGMCVMLTLEEYEVLRLIDYQSLSQQECADKMNIARSSVANLYANARKKMARFLIEGTHLEIDGGEYEVERERGGNTMSKVAVPCVNEEVFQHYGHCPQFLICELEEDRIAREYMLHTEGEGCQTLAAKLKQEGVTVVICGGIGAGAKNKLTMLGMDVFPGAKGNAHAQVESYLAGTLSYDKDKTCDHHEEGHTCHHEHPSCHH